MSPDVVHLLRELGFFILVVQHLGPERVVQEVEVDQPGARLDRREQLLEALRALQVDALQRQRLERDVRL